MMEVMVAIVITSIAVFGIAGAVLAAVHAQSDAGIKTSLDDDALSALSDVRMMTAYDPNMAQNIDNKTSTMTRTLPSGAVETISVTIAGLPGVNAVTAANAQLRASHETATATASVGGVSATETITLYEQAPAPGSVVNQ